MNILNKMVEELLNHYYLWNNNSFESLYDLEKNKIEFNKTIHESNNLYIGMQKEDIIVKILTEKIIKKESEILDKFENFLKKILISKNIKINTDEIKEEQNKNFLDYFDDLKSDLNDNDFLIIFTILAYFDNVYKYNFNQQKNCTIKNEIERFLKIDDLFEEKMYEKYKKRRKNDFYSQLGLTQNTFNNLILEIFKYPYNILEIYNYYNNKNVKCLNILENYSVYDTKNNVNILNPYNNSVFYSEMIDCNEIDKEVKIIQIIEAINPLLINLQNHQYMYKINSLNIDFSNILNEAWDEVLLSHLHKCIINSEIEFTLSMIIVKTEFNNIDLIINQLFNIVYYKILQSFYIESLKINLLSDNKEIDSELINNYKEQLEEKELIIEQKNEEIKILKTEKTNNITKNNKDILNIKKELETQYHDEIMLLRKQIEKQNKEIEELKDNTIELAELRKTFFINQNEEETFDINKIDLNVFKDKRYIFVGGRSELINKLSEVFDKSKFYKAKAINSIDAAKIEKIIIFPNNIGHSLYWEAIEIAKKNNIPFMFSQATNFELAIKEIYYNI